MDPLVTVKRNKKKKKRSPTMSEALCGKFSSKSTPFSESKISQFSRLKKRKKSFVSNSNEITKFKKYKKNNKFSKNAMSNIDLTSISNNLKLHKNKSESSVSFDISDKIIPTFSVNNNWPTVEETNKTNSKKRKISCKDKNGIQKKIEAKNKVVSKKAAQIKPRCLKDNTSIPVKLEKPFKKFKKLSSSSYTSLNSDEELKSVAMLTKKTKSKNSNFKNSSIVKKCKKSLKMNSDAGSSDSEEDQAVRNELENLSVFKNIQKLLKKHPPTFSRFENDPDSDEEIDSEVNDSSDNLSSQCSDEYHDESSETDEKSQSENVTKKLIVSDFQKSKISCVTPKTSEINFMRDEKCANLIQKNDKNASEIPKPFRNKAREKLQAAKFRFLNEKLYTESGKDSFIYFQRNKDEFMDYHIGYNLQVTKWPLNPVDKIIRSLQNMDKSLIIADMGCGDAKIARTLPHSVHSFDLVSLNEHVTPCNISKVPLKNESVDIVVFCLSLMGTNLQEYLREAFRILKIGGTLQIAEVESRIPDLDNFIKGIHSIGFTIQKKDVEHKLFVFLEFKKEKGKKRKREKKKKNSTKTEDIVLKPCLYKKR